MKKFKLLFVSLILLFVFVGTVNVNAACGSGAQVGGEFVCLVSGATQGNADGTAYPENGVLVLKNYNGGNITYSSGIGEPYGPTTIKLIGDNYITANDSYGLGVFTNGVNFIGDGTLTITSKLSIIGFNDNTPNKTPVLADTVNTIKIVAGEEKEEIKEVVEDTTTEEENNTDVKNEEVHWMLILVVVSCSVSVICLLVVMTTLLRLKKDKK